MNKVLDMAKCGSKDAPNGDYCPIPNPPLLPPMLHIPEPESRAVKAGFFPYSDLPDLSCRKTKTCPLTMLLTGKNQSLGKGIYMLIMIVTLPSFIYILITCMFVSSSVVRDYVWWFFCSEYL